MKLGKQHMNKTEEKGAEYFFKVILTENFSNVRREMYIHIHEAQRIPNKINPSKTIGRHIIINCQKLRTETNLKKKKREREI